MFQVGEKILLTLWVGGMWVTGYMVAPTLFATLDDRALAGMLAGRMFTTMSYIGLVCCVLLMLGQLSRGFNKALKAWRFWMLGLMLVIVLVGEYVIQPYMAELKLHGISPGTDVAQQFARLHGIASILFMVNSVAGLILVIFGLQKRKPEGLQFR